MLKSQKNIYKIIIFKPQDRKNELVSFLDKIK